MSEESWSKPPQNVGKVIAAFTCFFLIAVTDSVLGALVPVLEADYQISDLTMSYAFLSPVVGYVAVALFNGFLVGRIGTRGVSLGGLILCVSACALAAQGPPYAWLVVAYALTGFGAGLLEASWNAWMSALSNAQVVLGLLHGFYGLGGFIGPAVVSMLTGLRRPWQMLYAFLAVGFALALALVAFVFETDAVPSGDDDGQNVHMNESDPGTSTYAVDNSDSKLLYASHFPANEEPPVDEPTLGCIEGLCNVYMWALALFLTLYVGIEVGFSSWLVTFMVRQRQGSSASMPLVASGFWGGLALGRAALGFVTNTFVNQERVVSVYLVSSLVVYLTFMLTTSVALSSVLVILLGILVGPIYPSVMVIATRSLPKRLAVPGLGTAVALSGSGVAVFPFITGALVHTFGIQVFLPVFLVLFVSLCLVWIALPYLNHH